MACVEERSKKGKMGEGRETTDTKTTGAGVHLPAPFTVVFPVSALFFLDFPATSALFLLESIKRCCLISPNLISSPSLPFRIQNPHLHGTLPFSAPRIPPLYSPWAPTPPPHPPFPSSSPTSVWKRKFNNGNKMGKYLHQTTDFYRCTCYWLLNMLSLTRF